MPQDMKTKMVLLPECFLAILVMLTGCGGGSPGEYAEPVVTIRASRITDTAIVFPVRTAGKLASKTESKLGFKTGGIIRQIMVDEGQSVRKGQLLAQLNLEEISSRVDQAELALRKAERDYERAENLLRDSVVTLERFQDAGTALEVARSNASIAKFNLQYSSIHAPSDGKILKRIAAENEIIAPGHPVFLFAATGGDWVVRANLTDRDVVRVDMGDTAHLRFDAYPGEIFTGAISEIGTAADPYTGTFEIEIRMDKAPGMLVSGLIAKVDIYPAYREKHVVIPVEALVDGTGKTGYVMVLVDGQPERRKIQIRAFTDHGIVVQQGLSPGDELITEGAQYLRSGSKIRVNVSDE
jgi:multidrug efflux system membrane fusion protein